MKHLILTAVSFCTLHCGNAQQADQLIKKEEVSRIETFLASDEMRGRKTYSPEIDQAADFIANEFKSAGLKTWNNSGSHLQRFELVSAKQTALRAAVNGKPVSETEIMVITAEPEISISPESKFQHQRIKAGDNFFARAMEINGSGLQNLVLVDTSFSRNFSRLSFLKRNMVNTGGNTVFVLGTDSISSLELNVSHEITVGKLANVVGILPGKSRPNEYVIFSGHYDHIGVGKPVKGDSIYNGANDDAAGTTAVILLAKYYAAQKNNARTIVFAAFTAEEIGGFGSQYFSKQFDPEQVVAMFNIEMIGTESKWGRNSAYITGYDKTNMGEILQRNLRGSDFKFYPDPYPDQQLFYRSDNATFARLGVPAHTLSTSKMDVEPHYHQPSDHVSTLDLENMTRIIQSIAISARSIVAGEDSPTRVKKEDLR